MAILRNKISTTVCAVALAISVTGCYTDFEPDIKSEPVLCLNAVMMAGETIEADVTRTWRYTDVAGEKNHSVDDAVITMVVNGKEVDQSYVTSPGDKVMIKAVSRRYGSAEAEVEIPPVPIVSDLRSEVRMTRVGLNRYVQDERPDTLVTEVGFTFNLSVDVTVTDPGAGRHYFMAGANLQYDGQRFDNDDSEISNVYFYKGSLNYDSEPIFSEHMSALEAVTGYSGWGFSFFSDRSFEGGSYKLKLRFEHLYLQVKSEIPVDEADKADEDMIAKLDFGLGFDIETISDSFYNWANYLWQVNDGIIGDLGNIGLGAPVRGYSNVSTGAGVVAARTLVSTPVDLRDRLVEAFRRVLEESKY